MAPTEGAAPPLDPARRFVRVTGRRPGGFVEFLFAIGDPDLCVELILPEADFTTFCADQAAERLAEPELTGDDWHWRLSDARDTRFR